MPELLELPKELQLALAQIEKQFGKNSIFMGAMMPENIAVIPTNNLLMDLNLGVGGMPKGRIGEIFGAEGLGKSLIALSCAAACQKAGGRVAYIDVECDLDPTWCAFLGIDMDEMLISQPSSGEETLSIVEMLAATNTLDLIVVDSVAAMTPQAEIDGNMDDQQIGLQARMMSKGMRKLRPIISESQTCLLFLNQIRDKIGFGSMGGTTSPGGRALKFASSVRIELKHMGNVTDKSTGEILGRTVKAIILKNKVATPYKVFEYEIIHGEGFNNNKVILELATKYNKITKSGAWYYKYDAEAKDLKGAALGQGEKNASEYLKENPDFTNTLVQHIKDSYIP